MKAYPIPSCKGGCHQGEQPCKTEALCMVNLHRVIQPLSADEVTHAEYEEVQDDDQPWGLLLCVGLAAVAVIALPFILGAV